MIDAQGKAVVFQLLIFAATIALSYMLLDILKPPFVWALVLALWALTAGITAYRAKSGSV